MLKTLHLIFLRRDRHFAPLLLTISPLFVYIRNTVYRCVYSGGLQQEVYILRVLFLMIYQDFVNHFQASAAVDSHCEPLSSPPRLLMHMCICNTKYIDLVIPPPSVVVSHVYCFGCVVKWWKSPVDVNVGRNF